MEPEEYKLTFALEERHWWYKGLRNLIFSAIENNFGNNKSLKILDAGCGTGFTLELLGKYGNAVGVDIYSEAIKFCQRRGLKNILTASVSQLPFKKDTFDLIVSSDVLCHKMVSNDEMALREFHRVLKENGILIMNLPAYEMLKRAHDMQVHTRHRYIKNELFVKLKKANLKPIKVSYHNFLLFFAILFSKLCAQKNANKANSDLKQENSLINSVLFNIKRFENYLLKSFSLPFGSSLYCLARK